MVHISPIGYIEQLKCMMIAEVVMGIVVAVDDDTLTTSTTTTTITTTFSPLPLSLLPHNKLSGTTLTDSGK